MRPDAEGWLDDIGRILAHGLDDGDEVDVNKVLG